MLHLRSFLHVTVSSLTKRHSSFSKKLLHNPKMVKFGWSREVFRSYLPFTSELISARGRPLESLGVGYCPAEPIVASSDNEKGKRRVDDSWLEMVLPFSDQPKLRDTMMMDNGKTVRYGKLFELLDALAADVAYRHCGGKDSQLTIVTASVDGVKNFENIDIVDDIKMQGYITYTGSSSMEVTIDILASRPDGDDLLAETKFIMVARSGDKAAKVPGLLLVNEEAKHRFEAGAQRARTRRIRAQQSLSVSPPRAEEVHLIHNLYLEGIKQNRATEGMTTHDQQVMAMMLQGQNLGTSQAGGGAGNASDASATGVGNGGSGSGDTPNRAGEGKPVEVPTAAQTMVVPRKRWMKDTIFKSAQLMHVQDRNVHGKIFGGYIMNKAFEIAYVAAVCFFGENYPHFLFVDDIQFVKPMNVGSLAEFTSTVVYSSQGHIVVQVVVMSIDIISGERNKTNVLTYIFRSTVGESQMDTCPVPRPGSAITSKESLALISGAGGLSRIPEVLPRDYHQIVLYLEGKRALDQIFKE